MCGTHIPSHGGFLCNVSCFYLQQVIVLKPCMIGLWCGWLLHACSHFHVGGLLPGTGGMPGFLNSLLGIKLHNISTDSLLVWLKMPSNLNWFWKKKCSKITQNGISTDCKPVGGCFLVGKDSPSNKEFEWCIN